MNHINVINVINVVIIVVVIFPFRHTVFVIFEISDARMIHYIFRVKQKGLKYLDNCHEIFCLQWFVAMHLMHNCYNTSDGHGASWSDRAAYASLMW